MVCSELVFSTKLSGQPRRSSTISDYLPAGPARHVFANGHRAERPLAARVERRDKPALDFCESQIGERGEFVCSVTHRFFPVEVIPSISEVAILRSAQDIKDG